MYAEVIKDEIFYRQRGKEAILDSLPGGVTWSGGEALLQADRLEPLFRKLKEAGVHQCVETCLFVPADKLMLAMRSIDLFYVDVKILDRQRCGDILHGNLDQYLTNVQTLFEEGKPVVFRVPVIGGYTDDDENIERIMELIRQYPPRKVELIKEHNLGRSKYISLGRTPLQLSTVTDASLAGFKRRIENRTGIETEICRV